MVFFAQPHYVLRSLQLRALHEAPVEEIVPIQDDVILSARADVREHGHEKPPNDEAPLYEDINLLPTLKRCPAGYHLSLNESYF